MLGSGIPFQGNQALQQVQEGRLLPLPLITLCTGIYVCHQRRSVSVSASPCCAAAPPRKVPPPAPPCCCCCSSGSSGGGSRRSILMSSFCRPPAASIFAENRCAAPPMAATMMAPGAPGRPAGKKRQKSDGGAEAARAWAGRAGQHGAHQNIKWRQPWRQVGQAGHCSSSGSPCDLYSSAPVAAPASTLLAGLSRQRTSLLASCTAAGVHGSPPGACVGCMMGACCRPASLCNQGNASWWQAQTASDQHDYCHQLGIVLEATNLRSSLPA
jgi:hypothetical protein